MKLGRNFTNTFVLDELSEEEKKKVLSGEYDLFSMNALGLVKFKKDILSQIKLAKELGLDHIELDGDVPNPYPDFSKEEREKVREEAKEAGLWDYFRINHLDRNDAVNSTAEALTKNGLAFIAARNLHHYE